MEKVTGKEGKGVSGTGFEGSTRSNSYQQLPKSSNAAFGIEDSVAAGYSESAATPNTKGLNVGDSTRDVDGDTQTNAAFGIGDDIAGGTVPSRRKDDMVNAAGPSPTFGVSAKSGGAKMVNQDDYLGAGARCEGTAAAFGDPGRGGSMGLALKGLRGATGPGIPTQDTGGSAPKATLESRKKAASGMTGSGGAGNNDRS